MLTDEQCIGLVRSGYFRVDEDGSVWRQLVGTRTGRRRTIEPTRADYRDNNGYHRIRFGKRGTITAHRLVWLALCGPIPVGLEVNHKNLNKSDNRIANLETVTHLDNVRHAHRNGAVPPPLRGEANGQSKLTEADVIAIRGLLLVGEAKRAIARRFGVTPTLIRYIANGTAWKHISFPEVGP